MARRHVLSVVVQDQQRSSCKICRGIYRSAFARCPRDGGLLVAFDADPIEDSPFADRYVIEKCIGEGGMGRVYRARHARMSRRFAIKILFGELAADARMRKRFAMEAEAASRLDHVNLISVVDFGETDEGLLFLAMDYLEGPDLGELIDNEAPLTEQRTIRIVQRLCRGLRHAHDVGLVHRDFKPTNIIMVDDDGTETPKIVDFGIAMLPEDSRTGSGLTTEGTILGSPAYMSPEQATGRELDQRCDLFALGVIFYEMLAGDTPFDGAPLELAQQNVAKQPPPISERNPDVTVDSRLEKLVFRLMAKNRDDRPASADEVLSILDKIGPRRRSRSTTAPAVYAEQEQPAPEPKQGLPTGEREELTDYIDAIRPASGRRTWLLVTIAIVALAGVAAAILYARSKSGADDTSTASLEAAGPRPSAVAATDAAVAQTAGVDAAAATPKNELAETEPGPLEPVVKRRSTKTRTKRQNRSHRLPTTGELTKRYRSVGAEVNRLAKKRGGEISRKHQQRYFAIPYTDALRKPERRREVMKKLERLRRDVRRALR